MAKYRHYERMFRGADVGEDFDRHLTNVYKAILQYTIALHEYLCQRRSGLSSISTTSTHSAVTDHLKSALHVGLSSMTIAPSFRERRTSTLQMPKSATGSVHTRFLRLREPTDLKLHQLIIILYMRHHESLAKVQEMLQDRNLPQIPAISHQLLRSLSFLVMDDRLNDIERAAEGTCKWLLRHETYKTWSDCDRGLLCIKGKPGCGKSTLLQYALGDAIVASKIHRRPLPQTSERLPGGGETIGAEAESGPLVLSFFFHDRGTELQKTTLGLFRSLLHQLLRYTPHAIPDTLLAVFQDRKDKMGEPGKHWNWHWRELQEFFQVSLGKVLKSRPVWLFIDALDEYGEENANQLIKSINSWVQEFPTQAKFRVCLTCRHYPPLALPDGSLELCLEDENEYDISSYVQSRLSDWSNDENLAAIREDISNRASGIFMWARLVVERVLDLRRHGANWKSIKEAVDKSPDELNYLYRDLVTTMAAKPNSSRLITWICFAMRPLTLDELRWAMVVDPDYSNKPASLQHCKTMKHFSSDCDMMEMRVRSLSCGLVEAVPSTRVVQFIHQTVKDFFIQEGLLVLQTSQESAMVKTNEANLGAIAHYEMSRTCIRYLSAKEIMGSNGHVSADVFPLLKYATMYWLSHVAQSEDKVPRNDLLRYLGWPSDDFLHLWARCCASMLPFTRITTLLHLASRFQWMGALQEILQNKELLKTRIDASDGTQIPLCYAAEAGNEDVVRILLDNGADVNARGGTTGNALCAASKTGQDDIIRILLENGAEINARVDCEGFTTALGAASYYGHGHTVRLLLGNGADVNAQVEALHAASCKGNYEVILPLLDKGTDLDAQSKSINWALEKVVRAADTNTNVEDIRREECVRVLPERGANVNHLAKEGESLLVSTPSKGRNRDVRMLLGKKADLNAGSRDFNNLTALQVAPAQGNKKIVQTLFDYGAEGMIDQIQCFDHYRCAHYRVGADGHLLVPRCLLNETEGPPFVEKRHY